MHPRIVTLLAVTALLTTVAACQTAPEIEPNVEEVANHPGVFEGQTLTVTGEVDDIYHSRAFELQSDDDPFEIWEESVLVLSPTPIEMLGEPLEDDDKMLVRGRVEQFVVADIERELGWDLSPELEVEFENVPVIIADGVVRVKAN